VSVANGREILAPFHGSVGKGEGLPGRSRRTRPGQKKVYLLCGGGERWLLFTQEDFERERKENRLGRKRKKVSRTKGRLVPVRRPLQKEILEAGFVTNCTAKIPTKAPAAVKATKGYKSALPTKERKRAGVYAAFTAAFDVIRTDRNPARGWSKGPGEKKGLKNGCYPCSQKGRGVGMGLSKQEEKTTVAVVERQARFSVHRC